MVRIDFISIYFKELFVFQSNKRKEILDNPELDYFMNEERSDVVFVVEEQRIPALKAFLSVKSRVFHTMFSGEFKESKDKEVVIRYTTYEAFNTFIRFLYCDELILNDFQLIRELYRLSDRYEVPRLERRITEKLDEMSQTYEGFQEDWPKMQSILKIAFEFKIEKLIENAMEFIENHFSECLEEDNDVLIELNDSTNGQLFPLMVEKCTENCKQYVPTVEFITYLTKKCRQFNEILKQVEYVKCRICDANNRVEFIDTSTKCKQCNELFCYLDY